MFVDELDRETIRSIALRDGSRAELVVRALVTTGLELSRPRRCVSPTADFV